MDRQPRHPANAFAATGAEHSDRGRLGRLGRHPPGNHPQRPGQPRHGGRQRGLGPGHDVLLVMYPTAATHAAVASARGRRGGAAAITTLVFALAYRQGSVLPSRLLLVGIAVGFRCPGRDALVFAADELRHVQLRRHLDVGHAGGRRLDNPSGCFSRVACC